MKGQPARRRLCSICLVAGAAALDPACVRKDAPPPESPFAAHGSCRPCHAAIADSYRRVAMARSLYRPSAGNMVEDYRTNNHLFHAASGRHYRMTEHGGRFYQERYQLDERGAEVNKLEVEISYVIGSGNHARSYLRLSTSGELTQLPVTWYSQERRWGMSPGYDSPRQPDFGRAIDHGCMFCHNAYPDLPAGADRYGSEPRFPQELAPGIDCQRCHGPGRRHIELASGGRSTAETVRAAIVNPARLPPERQMDVCQQCHLEITSARLPQAVARFRRPVYSFRPGESLGEYLIHFDRPQGSKDRFEIVSAAYRLRQSACFLKSGGRLTCLNCHNPHRTPPAEIAVAHFRAACRACHAEVSAAGHPDSGASDCAGCHMPKRRTEDVVHVAMTDHLIQRKPEGDLLGPIQETENVHRGDLVFYDPPALSPRERNLYMGIALAKDGADRPRGIALLEREIAASSEAAPVEALIELADAYAAEGRPVPAAAQYRKALADDPGLVRVRHSLARELAQSGDLQAARAQYEQVIHESPGLPEAHNNLATLLAREGEHTKAAEEYGKALRSRPVYAEAQNNLARLYADQGRWQDARTQAEEALRSDPGFAPAFNTLGVVEAGQGRMDLAIGRFERALKLDGRFAEAHYNLGRALHAQSKPQAAAAEYRRAIALDPTIAPAHLGLGIVLGEAGKFEAAMAEFREALRLRPGYPDAERNLQVLLNMRKAR
jgi:predicted CXXCH cytochrome family protein